jgi:streptogrisin B
MSIHRITLAGALLAITALLGIGAPPAAAQNTATISPGDELVTTAADGAQMCTLGYTFTNRDTGTTYGITAGHCNGHRSSSVTDRTTGAVGHFVLTVGNADQALDDDYGLIDFGTSRSLPIMYGMPVSGISAPDPTGPVCHDGIKTGVACGQVHSRLFGTQFATSGMPQSIPGDSGGPVWQLGPDNSATVIGIWLGEHIEPNGPRYGRFTGLTDVLADIRDYTGLPATHLAGGPGSPHVGATDYVDHPA